MPALPRDKFRVEVGLMGRCGCAGVGALRRAGIAVTRVPLRHAFDVRGWRNMHRALATANPAILHAWGAPAVRAARWLHAPKRIASVADASGGGLSGWLAARALNRCDRIVSMTWAEAERYRRLGASGDLLTLIGPCVSPPGPPPDRAVLLRELGMPPNARFIATVGRLEPGSGLKDAIWTFDILRYDAPDLHLVIVGDGPERAALDDFVRAIAFDDHRVRFAGNRADVAELLQLAELVWVLGERSAANRALEAMAAGRPVVGWRNADLADVLVDGETGCLAEPGEKAQLSVKTFPLVHDKGVADRIGAAGKAHVAERFSVARAAEQWSRLYEEVAG